MRAAFLSSVALAVLSTAATAASAQTTVRTPAPVDQTPVPTVVIEDSGQASASHRLGDAGESGTSTFDQDSVQARAPGSGDVNEILKALPTVQFTSTQGRATRAELQDLRPENISISGGSIYENLFIVDGVGVNSRLDVENSNFAAFDDVANASAQTVWIDSSLVGEVVLRDSNISAEFGTFTGGVVEINTRAPRRTYGGQVSYGLTTSDMASYRMSDQARTSLGANAPAHPDFEKRRYGFNVDLPVTEQLRFLVGYNRSEADVTNYPSANYVALGNLSQRSRSENLLVKGEYDISDTLRLNGQVTWSPYESEFHPINSRDNLMTSHGGGWTARTGLNGRRGEADWSLDLSYVASDNDRDGPPNIYNVPRATPGFADCTLAANCVIGSVGPLVQEQEDISLKGVWAQPLAFGDIRLGFEYAHIEGHKAREIPVYSYLGGVVSPLISCVGDQGLACIPGGSAAARRNEYAAFDARASLDSHALWAEYNFDVAGFMIRTGLRYDYESFLGNHNFSPRLSVSRDLPWGGANLTVGLNRYYGRSFLGYALREGQGVTRNYNRTATTVNGQQVWSDIWTLTGHSDTTRYSGQGLDTPYSDEFSVSLRGPIAWIGGEYRIKGILRESRDQFASSMPVTSTYITDTGSTATRRTRTITNDGERSYEGLSLEYLRSFGRDHTVSLSTNLSHTDATNLSYFDIADETEFEGQLVYYRGQVMPRLQAQADNQLQDYANPFFINADWSANWLDGRIRTNVNARWRDSFERIDATGQRIVVDGVRYDIYDVVKYKSSVTANASFVAELARTSYGTATLDLRVNNLFNTVPDSDYSVTSQPYQLGRNVWVSLKYAY